MSRLPEFPVSDPRLVVRACNAAEPLPPGDKRWHDFRRFRHTRVVKRLQKVFQGFPEHGDFHHRVLCGHRGCGKSTELLQFKEWADANGFHCERLEVDVQFGHIDLEFSDFFLMAATAAESALARLELPIPNDALKPIVAWFADVTTEEKQTRKSELSAEAEAQLGGKLPFGLGKLAAKFASALKLGSEQAKTVRQQMRNYPDSLIDATNALLKTANETLAEAGRNRGLVLLFDNLDRYDPALIADVLLKGSSLLRHLGGHAIYTIPVDLEYNPVTGPPRDAFGQPVMLPMIALRSPQSSWRETVAGSAFEDDAVADVLAALNRRIVVDQLFENPDDAQLLVKMSGGCVRDLMHLVTVSYEMSDEETLSGDGVQQAIRELRATHVRELSTEEYDRLGLIAARKPVPRDKLTNRLLYFRWALEYYDESLDGKVWLDVHPLIVEIEEFRHAYDQHRPGVAG
jgi:hypothetical protein